MQALTGQSSTLSLPSLGLACPVIHKVRCEKKVTLTHKEQIHPLTTPKSNNDTPHGSELDRLAKAWTEMVVGFLTERNSPVPLSVLEGKIDIGKGKDEGK